MLIKDHEDDRHVTFALWLQGDTLWSTSVTSGVLQIEAMAQLGGIVMLDPKDQEAKEQFFFGGIEGCRFRRPVVPGDTLVSHTHTRTQQTTITTPASGRSSSST